MSRKPSEFLYDCPLCGRGKFTFAGLSRHWCFAQAQKLLLKAGTSACRLTDEQIQQAVQNAKAARKEAV